MGDQGICLAEILPSVLLLANLFFNQWAGRGQEDIQGQRAGSQALLALLCCVSQSLQQPLGSLWKQPQFPCHRWSLGLIWSQVKVCRAPGVDGTLSLNGDGGKPPRAPLLTQLARAAGLADLK